MSHFCVFCQSVFAIARSHQSTCCREETVGETITELECLYSNLSCDALQRSATRNHKRHSCCSLSEPDGMKKLINGLRRTIKDSLRGWNPFRTSGWTASKRSYLKCFRLRGSQKYHFTEADNERSVYHLGTATDEYLLVFR